jgi:transcriptional regulator with XRE-family HTH domain
MAEYPNRIAAVRKRRKLSQQALADLIGAHVVTISNLERGQLFLSDEWEKKLANALKVDPDDLVHKARARELYVGGFISSVHHDFFGEGAELMPVQVGIHHLEKMTEDMPRWVMVSDNSLYPVFQRGDVVRSVVILPGGTWHDVTKCFGKLCTVSDGDTGEFVGFMTAGGRDGLVTVAPINGPVQNDIEVKYLSLLDQAIYQPEIPEIEGWEWTYRKKK